MKDNTPVSGDELDDNLRDRLVAAGKAVASLVPHAGGVLGEILGAVIPGQRADRITKYLRQLSLRIDSLEASMRSKIAADPTMIELIEEGGYQAARALSDTRISQIVEAVANGIASDEAEIMRRTRLLKILGELDDDEVILLNAYGRNYGHQDEEAWERVNRPDPSHMQSPREDIDRERLFDAGTDHLIRLRLLEKKYATDRSGVPQFDKHSHDFKHRVEVSYLGRLLLREIGMPAPIDLEDEESG